MPPGREHFPHGADIGVRGRGPTRASAFEQAALALTEVITEPARIACRVRVELACNAADNDVLLLAWINSIIYEMTVRNMLFGRFAVHIADHRLRAEAWGEPVDRERHAPAVEPKGATFTELAVTHDADGMWTAQCVVDV